MRVSVRSIARVVLFISSNLVLFYFVHLFIFRTSYLYFEIDNQHLRSIISGLGTGLSLLFLISVFLSHVYNNVLIKSAYFASALWLGFLIKLLFLLLLNRLLVFVGGVFNISLNNSVIHSIFLLIALSLVLWGVINARLLRIKSISPVFKNLPDYWRDKKIIFISDVHLGSIYGVKFLSSLVKMINKLTPDLVIIGGDLFDGSKGDYDSFIKKLNEIKSLHGVCMIMGNHESYMNNKTLETILNGLEFKIINNKIININGLQIAGLNPYERKADHKTENILSDKDESLPLIMINHEPNRVKWIKRVGTDLMLSGHTHKGQFFPLNYFTRLIYGRNYYGFNREGSFQSYTSSGAGSWGPPIRTSSISEIVLINLSAE